jgi:hypothetical protein
MQESRASAWLAAEWAVAAYALFELGFPKTEDDFKKGFGPYSVSREQGAGFELLVDQFARATSQTAEEGWTHGRKTLKQAIHEMAETHPRAL